MGDRLGDHIELEISNVAHGGVMVARHEGRVVFVADAIPGEMVRAVITDDAKAKFWRADTVEVLTASEHRRPHVWLEASLDRPPGGRAGGAEFGHIALDHQRELKRRVLADALSRMAGIDSEVVVEELPGRDDGTRWRTRVTLHAADDGTIGPYAARSHCVIRVDSLPLATRELEAAAPLDGRFVGPVNLVAPRDAPVLVLTDGSTRSPITERVGHREFRLDSRGFWQVHEAAAETLSTAVRNAIDAEVFDPEAANLDLYGGVGLFAAAVGDRFGQGTRLTSVEGDALASGYAQENLVEWHRMAAVRSSVDRFLARLRSEGGSLAGATVVLDPPRSGAGKAVVATLGALGPAQLVYVACDPVALARDLALFAVQGYRLAGIRAFDLFPNTHHVEVIATLERT